MPKIKNVTPLGKMPTVDIEVDSEDHIYYANGIATSNSHAVCYAYNGYRSAFIKAHFPLQYVCAWLMHGKNEQKELEEISLIVSEAKRLGITVKGPSLKNLPEVDFFIDKDSVSFGIRAIKGCGENSFAKIENWDTIDFSKVSWIDFLLSYAKKMNKKHMVAMVKCGCFDFMMVERARAEFEFNIVIKIHEKELKAAKTYNPKNLLSAIESVVQNEKLTKIRLNKLEDFVKSLKNPPRSLIDNPSDVVMNEKNLLGINISCRSTEIATLPSNLDTCESIRDGNKEFYTLAGEVIKAKEIKTKNGAPMMFVDIADETEDANLVCFEKELKKYGISLYEGNIIMVKGRLGSRGGVVINEVYDI